MASAAFLVGFGLWALIDARSFYEQIATYPPYNRHLLHDIGAFQAGLGAALVAGLIWSDALFAGLVAASTGSVLHAIAHIIDRDLGGRSADPLALSVLALAICAAAVSRGRATGFTRRTK